jgi:hypothetical protein
MRSPERKVIQGLSLRVQVNPADFICRRKTDRERSRFDKMRFVFRVADHVAVFVV